MTPDELVETIRYYWLVRGYAGVRVWWEEIKILGDKSRIPRSLRYAIKSNIVDGYPPREKGKGNEK